MTPPPASQIEPLWTVDDVMTFTGHKRSWVYKMVDVGGLPALRLGGLRFVADEVRRWALRQRGADAVIPIDRSGRE